MALQSKHVTVGTAAVRVLEQHSSPQHVVIHNAQKSSNEFIWLGGGAALTTSTGTHLDDSDTYVFTLFQGNELWAVTDAGTKTLHVMWQEL